MRKLLCIVVCFLLLPRIHASDAPKYIALTIDDGPSGHFTTELLDGLAERDVKAAFFICGYRVEQFPRITRRIAGDGHEIGVHGDTHRFFSQMSPREVCADLQQAMQKIQDASGQRPTLLRPPGGIFDLEVLRQTVCCDLPVILWSIDVEDWNRNDSDKIAAEIVEQAKNGDIILLHDTKESSVKAALKIVDILQARGFEFVTVSELAEAFGTSLSGCQAYYQFRFPKKEVISSSVAVKEPCAKVGLPPPRPLRAVFKLRTSSRKSPSSVPKA